MDAINKDKFLILKSVKGFILGLEKILLTFPKKDILSRQQMYDDSLQLLELILKANYENNKVIKKSYR